MEKRPAAILEAPSKVTSARMRSVRQRDTGPELKLRLVLFAHGLRYRVHRRSLPGTPDIVFPRTRVAVFVHGCFWHGHRGCASAALPKSNVEFWREKLQANRLRDRGVRRRLGNLGWRVLEIWGCEVREDVDKAARRVMRAVTDRRPRPNDPGVRDPRVRVTRQRRARRPA